MIDLIPSEQSERDLGEFLKRLESLGNPPASAVRSVQAAIRAGFAQVFDSEGAAGEAPWAELAAATQRERRRLGFPPAHPILERTGDYRASFVQEGHAHHISEWDAGGGMWRIAEGSDDYRAKYHEPGGDIIPRRSVVTLGPGIEAQIAAALDDLFGAWFAGMGGR